MAMTCVNCGRDLYEDRCKVRCPDCGYFEDCSDPGAPGDWADVPGGAGPGGLRPGVDPGGEARP